MDLKKGNIKNVDLEWLSNWQYSSNTRVKNAYFDQIVRK